MRKLEKGKIKMAKADKKNPKANKKGVTKTELIWPEKRTDVDRVELPFQTVEVINLPRGKRQENLFGEDTTWRNRLIWGDNLLVMGSLLKEFAGKINLIYIDPPFATGDDFSFTVNIGDQAEIAKEPSALEVKAYRDTWGKGMQSYLQMMYDRLVLMKELLADDGSIYVHLDWHVGQYVKLILDEIFGRDNFRNEIVWHYSRWTAESKAFQKMHDNIYWYSKTDKYTYNLQYQPYKNPEYIEDTVRKVVDGKLVRAKDEKGEYIKREKENVGVPMHDVWEDVNFIAPTAKERLDYSTQKPEKFVERVIKASSKDGDLVADFFCGSGTTGAVAERLDRRWIMADLGRFAIHTTRKRLIDMEAKPFVVQNLGKYERHRWATQTGKVRDYIKFILELYGAEPVTSYDHLHGRKGRKFVHIGAVDAPVTLVEIQEALVECKENDIKELDVLGWEWEMGLHDLVEEEGERMGVKLSTFQIPREVLELSIKNKDLKNEVTFYELAYLEVETKVKEKKVTIELKDFIIPNPELLPEEVREKVKDWSDFIDYWAVDWMFNQHEEETEEDDTFHNMNQRYRTRKEPKLELSMDYEYKKAGKYNLLVKVIDIFGNDTTKLLNISI